VFDLCVLELTGGWGASTKVFLKRLRRRSSVRRQERRGQFWGASRRMLLACTGRRWWVA